ncbi:MBL fold metallo-hydrolase [Mangrovimonas xylaniphaga]|uniref:MBL fold metallo-hydrolase n=1 Tax=Mangrovimonas xylaniphaga TaxID=1645915 RepID=UPI0006B62B3B|nr:MBL fold metallo-hydrolase [Mangrovimonas xylaniphaga]
MNKKHYGAKPTNDHITQYAKSPNWNNDKFQNLEETIMSISIQNLPKLLYKQFFKKQDREPKTHLPIETFNKEQFLSPSENTKFIWYGHSVILLRMQNKTLLIDPMLGPDAAPIAPFPVKRFSKNTLDLIEEFPEIDLVLITHDHYDHLDYKSIKKLRSKVKHFYVALGVGRHLEKWGVPNDQITEFDWWEKSSFEGIDISFTPTRHFSGRGLTDRAKCLWGGWAFKTPSENIWFSGDGGYGKHFKEIGDRLGPFDFGFMECGQYNQNWHLIHMFPKESVQAARDAKVQCIMPVHWAGFSLAQHSWQEPMEAFLDAAQGNKSAHIHPKLGELVDYKNHENKVWWKD